MSQYKTYEEYRVIARKYITENRSMWGLDKLNENDFNHVCSLGASVMMARDGKDSGGSFVKAVVKNDLRKAIETADDAALIGLRALVCVNSWCHV